MLTEQDKKIIACLQEDLPLCSQPYQVLAEKIGISEEELLTTLKSYQQKNILRRLGAVIQHQQAGFSSNVMVVWQVPTPQISEVGKFLASFSFVSHCYQRPTYPNWPYNIFTMIHTNSPKESQRVIRELSEKTGIKNYLELTSLKELKKCSMNYFNE